MPPVDPQQRKQSNPLWLALTLAWDLGWIIALPAVAFGFGGASLDTLQGTSPLFLLVGLALAVTVSGVGVYRKVIEIVGKE